ncbi:hypothetical protein HD806DRAFT_486481 [Xylariaceae sp. AK1471]|nr:hypothetical protein HD806DRAFT_486481 [Xylariaceae sp. AK1471]
MYSSRLIKILMVALSIFIATRASWFHHDMQARQDLSLGLDENTSSTDESSPTPTPSDTPTPTPTPTPSDSPSPTPDPSSSTDKSTSSDAPTPTPTDSSSSQPPSTTPPSTGPITTPPTSTPSASVSPTASESESESKPGSESEPSDTSRTPTSKVTITKTKFTTFTDANGHQQVSATEEVIVSTPGFSGGGGSKNNDGLSAQARKTIIGVTVGVGGAIILAAGGILYWRLRNKRRTQDESEELISYGAGFGGPGTAEKSEASGPSASTRSPFQSTLETYHAPTQTNAASNF